MAIGKLKSVKIKIPHQGAPIVNHAVIIKKRKKIVCIDVACKSKYCVVGPIADDGFYIAATEDSVNLREDVDEDEPTKIIFPKYKDWRVYAASSGRYTISVCLIKP